MKRFCFLITLIFFSFSYSFGQRKDSIVLNDTMRVSVFKGIDKFYLYRYDSINMLRSMDSLIVYHAAIKKYNINPSLGNNGSSVFSPFYRNDISLGFKVGNNSRRLFLWEIKDLRFVNSHKRYTRVNYVNGSKKENYIEVEHSQSFGKNLDIGFRYNRINSLGYYTSQQTYYSRLNIYGRLSSRNKRYFLLFNSNLNSNKNQENGGIVNDSLFEGNLVNSLKFLPVNLTGAQSQVKDNSIMVHQHFDFGGKVQSSKFKVDSLNTKADSLSTAIAFIPRFRIGHEVSYRKNFFLYIDGSPTSGYYSDIYLDSVSTLDSIGTKNLENILSFNFFGKKAGTGTNFSRNYISFSVRHQFTEVGYGAIQPDSAEQNASFKTFSFKNNNIFIQGNAGVSGRVISKLWTDVAYCVSGYNAGDFLGLVGVHKSLNTNSGKSERVEATVSASSKMPDYIMQHYISNHFIWSNNFGKVFNGAAEAAFVAPRWKLRIGGAYNMVSNLVYFAQDAKPAQYGGAINILKVFVQKRFTVGKFSLDNDVTYQYVKDYMPVRLPAVVLRGSFFFEDYLFKKALHSRFGVDVYYNTAWNAYSYTPATGQFYLQDGKRYGNYPYIDVYAAFRVKGARFFFKLDHAFAGLLGNTYYGAAHYLLNGRTFKFGVDWVFLD